MPTGEPRWAPYLGLRFFDEPDAALYCGRDDQVDDVLQKLAQGRFVAVIGPSGCGKSSLIRAGVVPALRAMGKWQVVAMRPGGNPIGELAAVLERTFDAAGIELTLRRGRRGLIEAIEQCRRAENWNLLVIVDQFEELFRFQRAQDSADQAADFVKLILEAAAEPDADVCVLLTMRSDYLGNCSQFRDLPERINEGLYLVPRMRRDQMERAIQGPLRVSGEQMSPRLLQRLLNDVGDDPDQLPVLEHVLLRTWMQWWLGGAGGPLDLPHYEAVGGLNQVLDRHADEIYAALPEPLQHCAEKIFRRLTEMDEGRAVRRPTSVAELVEVCGGESEAAKVSAVLDAFRADGVSFLLPEAPRPIGPPTIVDIAHESLIRQWRRLGSWALAEEADGGVYLELAGRASQVADAQDYLSGKQLAKACQWLAKGFNAAWARRYGGDFEATVRYIEASRGEIALHKERVMTLLVLMGFLVLCLEVADLAVALALAATVVAWREWRRPGKEGARGRE